MSIVKKNAVLLGLALVLVVASLVMLWPPAERITMGLDIRGGLSVILTAQPDEGDALTADVMNRVETIVRNRVDGLGVREASVQRQGEDSLLIQIPGIDDPQEALNLLGEAGRLEFVDVASITDVAAQTALAVGDEDVRLAPGTYKVIEVDGVTLTGEVIRDASVGRGETNEVVVNTTMSVEGARAWSAYTAGNIGKQVAIVLDGTVKSAPTIQSAIPTGQTQISGNFTVEEANMLRTILLSGSLPVQVVQSEARIVGPTLGQDSLEKGVLAAIIGLTLVAVYVIAFYRGLGVITALALVTFASFFLGILSIMSAAGVFALTLPGIAGVVLTIGLAADSSILINERFKEEVAAGRSIRLAADQGSRHGIRTSIDADLVTMVSAIVLYFVAIGPVRGFALTLMIGIVCDFIMMLIFKRPLIILLAPYMAKMPKLWGLKGPDAAEGAAAAKGGVAGA